MKHIPRCHGKGIEFAVRKGQEESSVFKKIEVPTWRLEIFLGKSEKAALIHISQVIPLNWFSVIKIIYYINELMPLNLECFNKDIGIVKALKFLAEIRIT